MRNVLEQIAEGSRIAIVRLRSMGDCILTTPAIHLLRCWRPDLHLGLAVEPRFAPLFHEHPDLERILNPTLGAVFQWRPDLCLNFHGGSRSIWLTAASCAKWRAGFVHFRGQTLYNVAIPTAQEILEVDRTVHTAEHMASAMFYMGVPKQEIPRSYLACPALPSSHAYAVIHPFASQPDKTWPAERFLEVARELDRVHGVEPVFIGTPDDALDQFNHYRTAAIPLSQTMPLIKGAAVFIGNDSGPAHLAAAFQIPVVAIFGASNPEIWGPWKTASETLVSRDGIEGVTTEQVTQALQRIRVAA